MKPLISITKVILHHSLTADSKTLSWPAIRPWHMGLFGQGDPRLPNYNPNVKNPMEDIGYHYGIELFQLHYEVLVGRMENEQGAHCIGQNHTSLGICFGGNFDIESPPEKQWNLGLRLVNSILYRYRLPVEAVYGHCDFANKTCPGTMFDMDKFRNDLNEMGTGNVFAHYTPGNPFYCL
jgi:N-acetylmuramoyl-L-alanine amidase